MSLLDLIESIRVPTFVLFGRIKEKSFFKVRKGDGLNSLDFILC